MYQDDVMLIAIHLAGYSWLEADKLRKAMGKNPSRNGRTKENFNERIPRAWIIQIKS